MLAISLHLDGDNCWPDLPDKEIIHLANNAPPIEIALLVGGMKLGRSSITIRLDLPDGKVVLAETSLKLFLKAAIALKANEEFRGQNN